MRTLPTCVAVLLLSSGLATVRAQQDVARPPAFVVDSCVEYDTTNADPNKRWRKGRVTRLDAYFYEVKLESTVTVAALETTVSLASGNRWLRPAEGCKALPKDAPVGAQSGSTPRAPVPRANAASSAGPGFAVGTTVLGSPTQLAAFWNRCVVLQPPQAGNYSLECADEFRGSSGAMVRTLHTVTVPSAWVRADDPAFRPDMQINRIRQEIAAAEAARKTPPPAPKPNGPARAVQVGRYECWAFSSARMELNFSITGPRTYKASDGSAGTFTFHPASGRISFTGFLGQAMPEGFSALYHEPHSTPTVSFRSARGAEASFCERASK